MDFIAVTASVSLLLATYAYTQKDNDMPDKIEISEEVFVRKCGRLEVVERGAPISSQKAIAPCG